MDLSSSLTSDQGTERLRLNGVHHTARPTWKLEETVHFYRDILGLELVHAISAKGWGREGHPDFLHFFFDSGQGSTIAFFFYLGTDIPTELVARTNEVFYRATHTAWQVKTREELDAWRERLEQRGLQVSPDTRHEVLESIYFADPNGYPIEITLPLRPFEAKDARDADLTLRAGIQLDRERRSGKPAPDIAAVWRAKAALLKIDNPVEA